MPKARSAPTASDAHFVESSSIAAAAAERRRQGRRSQAERSTEMRARLLDATLECLEQRGYAGTSIGTVAKAAGVSRGAVQHHYPEKNFLVANALELAMHRMQSQLSTDTQELAPGLTRGRLVLDRMWAEACRPQISTVAEIRVAARTNQDLAQMLLPLEQRIRQGHYDLVATALGIDMTADPAFWPRMDALLASVRGLVMQQAYGWPPEKIDSAWQYARDDFLSQTSARP